LVKISQTTPFLPKTERSVSEHDFLNDNEQLLTPPLSFMGGVEWLRAEIC